MNIENLPKNAMNPVVSIHKVRNILAIIGSDLSSIHPIPFQYPHKTQIDPSPFRSRAETDGCRMLGTVLMSSIELAPAHPPRGC